MITTELLARRRWIVGIPAAALLAACGGDLLPAPTISEFSADRTDAFVGDTVRLTARFSGGTARIEPGVGAVSSGIAVRTVPLAGDTRFRLIVSSGATQVARELTVKTSYRNVYRKLAQPFISARHVVAFAPDGALLVIGGSRGGASLSARIDRFDPATETFTALGQLGAGREFHTATELADGRVLIAGGQLSLTGFAASELIDPRTGAVIQTGALKRHRQGHTATRLADGRVLVTGGWGPGGDAIGLLASAEIFNPATGEFRLLAESMVNSRGGHSATLLADGRVLIAGGFSAWSSYRYAELFDPATEKFTPVASQQQAQRAMHAAHRLGDGSVLLVGGESGDGSFATNAVLRYVPARQTIEPDTLLLSPRTVVASAQTADDRVLLFGGIDADLLATRRAEALRPGVGGSPLPDLPRTRAWHSATRLANGRVLVLGGEDWHYEFVPDALLYE